MNLMLKKRKLHYDRQAEAIAEQRGEEPSPEDVGTEPIPRDTEGKALSWTEPRRVDNTTLFLKMGAMRGKGGTVSAPLC
jgi:hypothetical protein